MDRLDEELRDRPVLQAIQSGVDAMARRLAQSPSLKIVPQDWDLLFSAIKAKLKLLVGEERVGTGTRFIEERHDWIRDNVLECVAAMDLLHAALKHERAQLSQLELEVSEAHAMLAHARAELVGTQAEERRSRHMALHDALTSLPNRIFFRDRLDSALAQPESTRPAVAVFFLDLDDFKQVNDTYGHQAGDEMLRIVAARLARAVRSGDLVSRLGGDEFACLLVNISGPEQLQHLAEKLLDAVCAPIVLDKLKLDVRSSIGIALCPAHGSTADELLRNADAAMYRAKRLQSGFAFFEPRVAMLG
ncbi:MAG TPA: GGDEF domain-containing protein [Burkholderiaceae bacterium]|nr:GGDEF domain-containing protein [Burkholderiaceae bacterium]